MLQALVDFFVALGFMPHGYCLLWSPGLIGVHAVSDVVTALAYFSIPIAIMKVLRRRDDIKHPALGFLFAAFILACGVTHVMNMLVLWLPAYGPQAAFKLICAFISGITAITIFRLLDDIIALPGPHHLETANAELRGLHAALQAANADLEARVAARTAALEHANEELQRFAYVASHDLRAPLRALTAIPEWLRESIEAKYGALSPEIGSDLFELERQGARMTRLLDDLLAYARIDNTRKLACEIDPGALIREAAEMCGLDDGFRVEIDGDLPRVSLVPTEFSLVVRNLITNAQKHHDRETGVIRFSGHRAGQGLVLYAEDDGPGIDSAYGDRIFEMFTTLRSRDEVEGSGMGLAMVQKIMEREGGSIALVPRDGQRGARFRLEFPNVPSADPSARRL